MRNVQGNAGAAHAAGEIRLSKSTAFSLPVARYLVSSPDNAKAVALITQISPAAWRHILLNGHYTFHSDGKMIDLDAIVAGLNLG